MTEALLYERDRRRPERAAEPGGRELPAPQEETRGDAVDELVQPFATLEKEHREWVECNGADMGQVEAEVRTLERRLRFRRDPRGSWLGRPRPLLTAIRNGSASRPDPPPANCPWDGLRRQSELRLTREALGAARRAGRQAQVAYWALRLLTLRL